MQHFSHISFCAWCSAYAAFFFCICLKCLSVIGFESCCICCIWTVAAQLSLLATVLISFRTSTLLEERRHLVCKEKLVRENYQIRSNQTKWRAREERKPDKYPSWKLAHSQQSYQNCQLQRLIRLSQAVSSLPGAAFWPTPHLSMISNPLIDISKDKNPLRCSSKKTSRSAARCTAPASCHRYRQHKQLPAKE